MKKHSTRHKNNAFSLLFNDPDKLRKLYNDLSESSYGEETPVTITTLKDELFDGPRNDIAFTIDGKTIVLIEHQSTINPNMPLRLLFYITAIYDGITSGKSIYGKAHIKLPRPEFYLFYNGKEAFPQETTLRLSDAFEKVQGAAKLDLELEVKAYNINTGYNKELMEKNRDLDEYARFVEVVRRKRAGLKSKNELERAFRLAIKECIEHNILKELLQKCGEEVMNSLNISWEEYEELRLSEALEEEKHEIARKLKTMSLTHAQIAEATGLSPEEIEKL